MKDFVTGLLKFLAFLGVCLVLIQIGPHKPYDFKKTLVKVSGIGGSGSGNIIKSDSKSSVILTNKHVCEGVKVPPVLDQVKQLLTFLKDKFPQCSTFSCYSNEMRELDMVFLMMFLQLNELPDYVGLSTDSIDTFTKQILDLIEKYKMAKLKVKFNGLKLQDTKAITIKVHPTKDLCLIQIPVGNLMVAKIGHKLPKVGDKVQTIGNPLGVTNHMVEGFLGDNSLIYDNIYTLTTAPIFPGQSGSGVFDMDGRLIGVNTLSWVEIATIGYMIPLNDILEFIN